MSPLITITSRTVTGDDVQSARLGSRFGRMDLMSQLAMVAVESLGIHFDEFSRDRTAVCLAAGAGSLTTDFEYWKGRDAAGGPSPTLFTYTLPSAAIGEIAIRHGLTGPNLCFVGNGDGLLAEAEDLIQRGEADACICVVASVISAELAEMIKSRPVAEARAYFLKRETQLPS